ncbi:sigma-70 family RNA polymerase sigma factor [Actinoplanes couchii]|uniref:RNA polymerase, sigma-24 subunit, ECF subfamily n=1 Tax=Actinoplanes couchii TaxID=403638 RepID=A0ABQ3XK46_9ACTN|nr:sigma-70 family RNA polymerase sigma factor [Actinoplanes couchii]MDR6320462.1 RNA polymerase sigma factor (sigma-70 family) [Actinoplanes couchii]GID58865.1 hypothetical protein Aco03nite_072690 [Actinoplanes couchii]
MAARAGDRAAAEELMAAHLPMLYRIVGRALDGHADVDDVVQETVLRAHRDLAGLRTPESFRSWLVAIAMHQISGRRRRWLLERDRSTALSDVPDPDAEFTGVALLRLDLSAQRRQTARATRWLNPDDRELALRWWRELTGERTRAEVVAGLGIGAAHARVRLQRMRRQLELCRRLVAALETEPRCPDLDTTGWDGEPSPRWRKRFARHLRGCGRCGPAGTGLVPVDRLLLGASPMVATLDPLGPGTDWFAQLSRIKVAATVAVVAAGLAVILPRLHGADQAPPATMVLHPAGRPDAVVDLDGDRLAVMTGTPGAALTMVPGFTDRKCFSLRYADGRYVRHSSFQLVLDEVEDSLLFREDATFCTRPGVAAGTVRFTSVNYPDRFLRAGGRDLRLDPGALTDTMFTLVRV